MANFVYPYYKELLLTGQADWTSGDIKLALVRDYTPSTSHKFLNDVTGSGGGEVAAASGNLTNKSATNGVADADDVTLTSVAAGDPCDHIIFYVDTGVSSTSPLVACIDTATGLPITPNGGDIEITFDDGANKIFAL